MSAVLKLAEQMVKLDRLIKTSRDDKLKRIMRDEYKRLARDVEAAAATQTKVENRTTWRCGMCEYIFTEPVNGLRCPSCDSDEIEHQNKVENRKCANPSSSGDTTRSSPL